MPTPAAAPATAPRTFRRLRAAGVVAATTLSLLVLPQFVASASAAPTRSQLATIRSNMLTVLNAERRAHGVRAVKMNSHLVLSARRHDVRMAKANCMSHQLSGEGFFADRMTAAGYDWAAAAENIGVTTRISNRGVISVQKAMYREKAPNDGHRVNILNGHYTAVGIDVYYDRTHHKLWFTQDFGRPA